MVRIWAAAAAMLLLKAGEVSAQTNPYHVLSYRPVAAEYSKSLDRLILVNSGPNQLHIYDPVTKGDTAVALALPPTSLAVSTDGEYALVGHASRLSYVKLSTAIVEKTLNVSTTPTALALASNGYAYAAGAGESLHQVNLGTGVEAELTSFFFRSARLRISAANKLFVTSELGISRLDLITGTLSNPVSISGRTCGGTFALREDWAGAYTGCGGALRFAGDASSYGGSFESPRLSAISAFSVLTHSSARAQIAAVIRDGESAGNAENQVYLFNDEYLVEAGRFNLPNFLAGPRSFPGLARFVFFDKLGSRLIVVAQAPPSAGILNDFGIATYSLDSASCPVTLSSEQGSLPGSAERGSVMVTAGAGSGCIWAASTAASWITITHNSVGMSGALRYAVDANYTGSSRTGAISIGGAVYSLTQAAVSAASSDVQLLPSGIVDAEFSKTMDRIVLVTAAPHQLHIVNGSTGHDTAVRLNLAPRSVTVQGGYAAVGHDGWISYVNLNTAAVERVYRVNLSVDRVVLGKAGYVYGISSSQPAFANVNIATGSEELLSTGSLSVDAALHPSGDYLYTLDSQSIGKWNLTTGPATFLHAKSLNQESCRKGWLSEEGLRLFTGCGGVYRLVEIEGPYLAHEGKLPLLSSVVDLRHSASRGRVYTIPGGSYLSGADDTNVHVYRDDFFALESSIPLPGFSGESVPLTGRGRFIFLSADSSRIHVILQGWSGGTHPSSVSATDRHAVYSARFESLTPCTYGLAQSASVMPPTGGTITLSITTRPGCKWSVTNDSFWLSMDRNSGIGPGTIRVTADPNTGGAAKYGSVVLFTQTAAITQPSFDTRCSYTFGSNYVALPPTGGDGTVTITTSLPSCSWGTVKPHQVDWIAISPAAGAGNATVTITASANSTISYRTVSVNIAGNYVQVAQGATCRYNLPVNPQQFSSEGGTGTISILALRAPCSWTASSSAWWAQIDPPLSGANPSGTIYYRILPNWNSQPRTATFAIGAETITITQAGSTLSANERFVGSIYTSFLGRIPFPEEIAFQVNEGLNRGLSRAALVMNFFNSAEFNGEGRFIAGLYVGLLDRTPEYAGWVFQRTALAGHATTQTALVSGFLGTPEYALKFGNPSNAEFVRLLYRYILLREATDAEVAFQSNALSAGTTRTQLAANFLNTAEFRNGAGPRLTAFLLYSTLLLRDASAGDLAARIAQLQSGMPVQNLVTEFLSTPEFNALLN